MGEHIAIDGSHGEGGGQLLRTAVTLSAITGQALVIEHIRAGRRTPGLAAQHLTAVLSVAKLCEAEVAGATLSSETLSFRPKVRPQPGNYVFDVAKAREGGSAGAAALVLQAVALAAVLAEGACHLRIGGGTHVPRSPSYDFIADVWRPFLGRMGISLETALKAFGFYPRGQGEIIGQLKGLGPQARTRLKSNRCRSSTVASFAQFRDARLRQVFRRTFHNAWPLEHRQCSQSSRRASSYDPSSYTQRAQELGSS